MLGIFGYWVALSSHHGQPKQGYARTLPERNFEYDGSLSVHSEDTPGGYGEPFPETLAPLTGLSNGGTDRQVIFLTLLVYKPRISEYVVSYELTSPSCPGYIRNSYILTGS